MKDDDSLEDYVLEKEKYKMHCTLHIQEGRKIANCFTRGNLGRGQLPT